MCIYIFLGISETTRSRPGGGVVTDLSALDEVAAMQVTCSDKTGIHLT